MNNAATQSAPTFTIETIAAALNALPGVKAIVKDSPAHRAIFVNGKFVGTVWCGLDRGKLNGKIRCLRDVGVLLGRPVYQALAAIAPVDLRY